MSSNTITLVDIFNLVSEVRDDQQALAARVTRLEENRTEVVATTPAKVVKAAQPKAVTPKKATGKALTRANRPEFVKAAPWAKGLSCREIAFLVAAGEAKCPKGFRIGEGYAALGASL